MPMMVMPAGIVTLLGALLRVPSPRMAPGENHLDRSVSAMAVRCVITFLETSLWSSGLPRFCSGVFGGKFWFSLFFVYLDLLVRGFPHHIVSVRPLWLYL
jgi:hypothetical protein